MAQPAAATAAVVPVRTAAVTRTTITNTRTPIVAEADVKLAAIDAAYTDFESTGDLHELARAVGVILDRREDG